MASTALVPAQGTIPQVQPQGQAGHGLRASERVFENPELTETILLNLGTKDLLLAQGTCKFWRQLYKDSPVIQRALFMKGPRCGAVNYMDWHLDDQEVYLSCGSSVMVSGHIRGPRRDQPPFRYPAHWGKTRYDAGDYRIFLNPLLAKVFPFLLPSGVYFMEEEDDYPDSFAYEEASWRKMFFTQPPIAFLSSEYDSPLSSLGAWTLDIINKQPDAEGIYMGELFDRMNERNRAAIIQGNDQWEEWTGVADLNRIEVNPQPSDFDPLAIALTGRVRPDLADDEMEISWDG